MIEIAPDFKEVKFTEPEIAEIFLLLGSHKNMCQVLLDQRIFTVMDNVALQGEINRSRDIIRQCVKAFGVARGN